MTPPTDQEIAAAAERLGVLVAQLNTVLYGQEDLVEMVVTGMLAGGHLLLEGLPGLGKTELVKGLAQTLGLPTKRIQFTPDLLPGDITGNPVLQETDGKRSFVFQPGPLFASLVLADEINRASPKTQSALLEAMQERHVTVLGQTHPLPEPFHVLATQNPIELEGTYPLPEAQLDRFLFKLDVTRGGAGTLERIVLHRELGQPPQVPQVMPGAEWRELMALARRLYLPPVVANYIARVVEATHPGASAASAGVKFGASPRAALSLAAACKARALLQGRPNASFEDARALAPAVLRHRIILDYQARVEGKSTNSVIAKLLKEIPFDSTPLPRTLQPTGG
jgi:MoxR-like ATPase